MNIKNKKLWVAIIIIIFILIFTFSSTITAKQREEELATKNEEIKDLKSTINASKKVIKEKDSQITELEEKVDKAKPWFEMSEKDQQRKIAEEKSKEEAEAKKKAEEEAKKEAEAKKKAEEEAKKGYETGITYNQLARTPDDFKGEKVKFSGKVIQVMEGDTTTQIRLAVGDNYDTILYGEYDSSLVKSRVLEDDQITIMGLSAGLLTYESTMGGNITIPSVLIEKIES
ncbi:toxin regulator [Oceanobacillus caeni]|uniref:toxin regulator n=1 Tax=Oceanobacillus caeni TaxID=405946 RepID=UPI001C2430FE|nr:toxin regulator [Oceanobacillus caeni]MBU8789998.1 toxin regulator [Oceanobacillus caeni]